MTSRHPGRTAHLIIAVAGLFAAGPTGAADPVREEVTFKSGADRLAGVLVRPPGPGPHPAVAFVHGSGPLGRADWTSHPALRDHLAARGIACLCWDKPGVGASTGDWARQSFRDRADEAIAAVRYLGRRADVDPKRVGLWGISQGGWVCPLAGSLAPDVAFLVLVSAPAGTVADQDLYRVEAGLRADGRPAAEIDAALAFARRRVELVRGGTFEALDAAQTAVAAEPWFADYVHRVGAKEFAFARHNLGYDGGPALAGVKCPVLVVVAERDTVVPAKDGAAAIKAALAKAGNADVAVKVVAGADHFMRAAATGGPKEMGAPGRKKEVVPEYLETVTDWLAPRVRPR
jgi:pimeloyl-ACP methyl ester carboxylesterase